jgi:RHS repeat-associated protein
VSVTPGYIADDKAATAKAIEQFHVRLSKGQIDEIYSDADESFRRSQTREVLITAIQATRARFGGFKTMTHSELNVIVGAPVQIRAAYDSIFEKGNATELFVFLKHGNKVQLSRYEIYPWEARSSIGSWSDAVYVHAGAHDAFYGALLSWVSIQPGNPNIGFWKIMTKDGTTFKFPDSTGATNPFCSAPISMTDRYGNTVKLDRTATSQSATGCNLTKITSPNGRTITLTHDTLGRITQAQDNSGRSVSYTYDAVGRLSTVTDVGNGVTTYTYDDQNRMTTIQDARGIVYLMNQYDSAGRVVQQTMADNSTSRFNWTPTVNTAQTFVLTAVLGGGGGTSQLITGGGCWGGAGFNRYDSNCGRGYLPLVQQVDITDPRGYVERVKFGPTGNVTSDTQALGQPEEQTVTYQYYSDNLLKSVTDALGRVNSYDYDGNGNTTRVTRLDGDSNAVTTTFSYEPQFNHLASVTDPLNHTSTFSYDRLGNLVAGTDPLSHQVRMGYNTAGQLTSVSDALNNTLQFGYFGGDLVSVTDPLSNVATQFVDPVGRVVSATDAQGNTAKAQYNNLNLLTQTTDAQGNSTSFTYDANGNLLSLTDALNHATSYTYDNMDRALTRMDPLNRQENYVYDLEGNLVSSTDRKGQVTSVTYDALNRVKLVGYNTVVNGGNTTYESTISYTYDAGNRLTQAVDSASGTITRAYDNLDRLISETTPQGSISYSYDAAGRRTTMQVTGQPVVNYSYDTASRLTQISQGTSSTSFGYDNANRRTSLTLPNGLAVSYGYDNGSQLTGIRYQFGSNTLGNLTYAYDQLGRRTQVGGSFARTGLPGAVVSTVYDAANELTNWNGTGISYDLNGNMIGDGSHSFNWNARDEVATLNGVSLQYDAFGRRIKNATARSFLYDGENATQELLNGSVTANIWTGAMDEFFQRTDSNGTMVPLTDALGSVLALADANGNATTQYSYDPFGNTNVSGAASSNPLQYTGRENESNGLYYYRARYYSPVLGRFISEDPLAFGGGDVNLYGYVWNSSPNFIDPLGYEGHTGLLPHGGGIGVGGSVEAGLIGIGAGGTSSVGTGVFFDGIHPSGGSFASGGAMAGGPGWGVSAPSCPNNKNWIAGAYAGVGVNVFLTNAKNVKDLAGPFKTFSAQGGWILKAGGIQMSIGKNNAGETIWIFSYGGPFGVPSGVGFGASMSNYNTNTVTKGGGR